MRLIAILLSLWANRYPERIDRWRRPEDFHRYADWVWRRSRLRDGVACLVAIVLPPVLVMGLLQWLIGDWVLGLGELVLGVVVLIWVHGPGRVDDALDAFLVAWRDGHLPRAREAVAAFGGDARADEAQLPTAAAEGLFLQSYRKLFAGIFWFLLLGPAGGVLVQATVLTRDHAARRGEPGLALEQAASALLFALDWLPARATALSFGLAGSFVHAVEGWRAAQEEPDAGPQALVVRAGIAALHASDPGSEPGAVEEALRDARDLVWRSLMIWMAVVALLTIAGWIY